MGNTRRDITIERRFGTTGTCKVTMQSTDASWRPAQLDTFDIWETVKSVSSGIAITSGSSTVTMPILVTSDDVGKHIRITGAGLNGYTMHAKVSAYVDPVTLTLDMPAQATVTNAAGLLGTCRFVGVVSDVGEARIGTALNTREFDVNAQDLKGALDSLFPRAVRAAETVRTRIIALLANTAAEAHGIGVNWSDTIDALVGMDAQALVGMDGQTLVSVAVDGGSVLSAQTYDGSESLTSIFDAVVAEDNDGRAWDVDEIGRVFTAQAYTLSTPASLTTSNVLLGVNTRKVKGDYYNRVVLHYGTNLDSYVVVSNSTEIAALSGRVYEFSASDSSLVDLDAATTRANALLAQAADRSRYTLQNLVTLVDGFSPGQFGSVTISERGVSGTHLVMGVISRYFGLAAVGMGWQHSLTVTNGTTPTEDWPDYWLTETA